MTIAECLRSISFNEIEEILWDAYGMGGATLLHSLK